MSSPLDSRWFHLVPYYLVLDVYMLPVLFFIFYFSLSNYLTIRTWIHSLALADFIFDCFNIQCVIICHLVRFIIYTQTLQMNGKLCFEGKLWSGFVSAHADQYVRWPCEANFRNAIRQTTSKWRKHLQFDVKRVSVVCCVVCICS